MAIALGLALLMHPNFEVKRVLGLNITELQVPGFVLSKCRMATT